MIHVSRVTTPVNFISISSTWKIKSKNKAMQMQASSCWNFLTDPLFMDSVEIPRFFLLAAFSSNLKNSKTFIMSKKYLSYLTRFFVKNVLCKTNLKCLMAASSEGLGWVVYWKPKYHMLFEPACLFLCVITSCLSYFRNYLWNYLLNTCFRMGRERKTGEFSSCTADMRKVFFIVHFFMDSKNYVTI